MTAEQFIEERFSELPYEYDDIINLMNDYAAYCVKNTLNEICMENDKFVDFLKYFNTEVK